MAKKQYKAIAEYYDSEYAASKMLQQDVPFFLGQLPKKRQSILELATGTARAAIPMAQSGHRVVGIDYDPAMIEIAIRKRDGVGLRENELSLKVGNILSLKLNQKFDWICLFFNTLLAFTTLQELDLVLTNIRKHLKPNGRFWLDIFQPNLRMLAEEHTKNAEPTMFYVDALNRTVFSTTEVRRDPATQTQQVTFHYRWFDDRGVEHREKNQFQLTSIFPRELQLLLERNGLRIERSFGNYDGSELEADSPRMIARCVLMK